MVYPWHLDAWQQLANRLNRLPHALLIGGPEGLGKRAFAQVLAARLLCDHPKEGNLACGVCEGCRWFASGNHPDYRLITPEAELADEEGAGDGEPAKSGGKDKRSLQIRIEQIRSLAEYVGFTHHRPTARVVVIQPAEAMNVPTANALLKVLEEPPDNTVFLLVSHQARRLLPTIRSRCQSIQLPSPRLDEARAWLEGQGGDIGTEVIAFCGGLPLSAQELASGAGWQARQRFVRDVEGLPVQDPISLAGQWEAWLKSKESAGMDLPTLVTWLQKWLVDLTLVTSGGNARYFPDRKEVFARIAATLSPAGLTRVYREVASLKSTALHPVNPRLFLDDLLLRVARLWAQRT